MADARSMCDRMTPPKIVPCALVSFGSSNTLMAGIRAAVTTLNCRFKRRREEREGTKVTRRSQGFPYHAFSMSTATNGRAAPTTTAATSPTRAWSVHDASELYEVSRWGNGYFSVNALGHLEVHPTKDPQRA